MRAHRVSAAVLAILVVAGGCGSSSPARAPADHSRATDLRSVRLTASQLDDMASADSAFASDVFSAAADRQDGNVVMSPASIAIALEMAYAGARGQTAKEMARVLHVQGTTPTDVAAAASQLLAGLADVGKNKGPILSLVNQLWVQDGFPLTTSYRTSMDSGFGAAFRRADFSSNTDGARRDINGAVAAATHNRIRDLIAPGLLTEETRLVLTNAVYLRARWASEFDRAETRPAPFHRADGSAVDVETMHQHSDLGYIHRDGYRAVVLPYVGGRLSMTILLPDGPLDPLLTRMRTDGLGSLTAGAKPTALTLELPRFRFTWAAGLGELLARLGMPTAFSDAADFAGISTAERLKIAFVQHKAFVELDEHGTEAAAATAVGVTPTGAIAPAPERVVVRVDHPFLFEINDTTTGLPLFLGRVADPLSTVGG